MKTFAKLACGGFSAVVLLLAAAPTARAAHPAQITLRQPVRVQLGPDQKPGGWMSLPAGLTVPVSAVQGDRLLIDFAGAPAWIPQADTDFAARSSALQTTRAQAEQTWHQKAEVAEAQKQQAGAYFQGKLDGYVSPLENGPYGYNRSVVDYYDECGNRYNIGVFGQRIYN